MFNYLLLFFIRFVSEICVFNYALQLKILFFYLFSPLPVLSRSLFDLHKNISYSFYPVEVHIGRLLVLLVF